MRSPTLSQLAAAGALLVVDALSASVNSQVHLAYAGSNAMTVSWNTLTQLNNPTVLYGLSPKALFSRASSDVSTTYNTSTTYNNHVKITGLQPNTIYYYLPESLLMDNATTPPYHFRTARAPGDTTPFSVAVAVDMGTMGPMGLTTYGGSGVPAGDLLTLGENNTIQSLTAAVNNFDFLWQPGDIAYADQWLNEEIAGLIPNTSIANGYQIYEEILNDFYDQLTPVTTLKPYMVGPGNHDSNCDNSAVTDPDTSMTYNTSICLPGQLNFTGYINHFRMPSDESKGTGNFWYSFNHGMVHFIQLDSETDIGDGFVGPEETGGVENDVAGPFGSYPNAQRDWLEADLAAVNRTKTPWIVVAGHRPWYISFTNSSATVCWSCKDVWEPLFLKYGVDLYISGHQHSYERMAPIANGVIDPNELNNPSAPWYILNGAAGHYKGLSNLVQPYQPYHRFSLELTNATYGWSKLTFHNCTHLTHEFVASGNGTVLDSATLYKDRKC